MNKSFVWGVIIGVVAFYAYTRYMASKATP